MPENWVELLRIAACGGVGGFIYWAAREHGGVFVTLWNRLVRRNPISPP